MELLARDWGQGVVELGDPESHAFRAGYTSPRAARTWTEQIRALESAGLVEVDSRGRTRLGIALIVHPQVVIARQRQMGHVGTDLWEEYKLICEEFGIDPAAGSSPGSELGS